MLSMFKKKKMNAWVAYLDGEVIPLQLVPDEIFSKHMMGEGLAIIASHSVLTAPMDGRIILIAPTKHAIAIQTEDDFQVLLHIGLDSAMLPADCFRVLVDQGMHVKQGEPLLEIADSYLSEAKPVYVPMVIVENPKGCSLKILDEQRMVFHGESVIVSYD